MINKITEENRNTSTNIDEDVIAQVLGPEHRGSVQGMGLGATPSRVKAQAQCNVSVKELETKLHEQNEKMTRLEEKFDKVATMILKQQVNN